MCRFLQKVFETLHKWSLLNDHKILMPNKCSIPPLQVESYWYHFLSPSMDTSRHSSSPGKSALLRDWASRQGPLLSHRLSSAGTSPFPTGELHGQLTHFAAQLQWENLVSSIYILIYLPVYISFCHSQFVKIVIFPGRTLLQTPPDTSISWNKSSSVEVRAQEDTTYFSPTHRGSQPQGPGPASHASEAYLLPAPNSEEVLLRNLQWLLEPAILHTFFLYVWEIKKVWVRTSDVF